LPGVPTSLELGIKDLEQVAFWISVHVPKATPAPIVAAINTALNDVYKIPALKERMAASGLNPGGEPPAEFAARLASDLKLYAEIFKAANIKIE
jgi:tripartite-type tricarboxylate transporter receptor subunit TctC